MSKPKGSPRKFSEKIALLEKNEAEINAEFEKAIKEAQTTRASFSYPSRTSSISSWIDERHHVEEQAVNFETYHTNNYGGMVQHNEVLHVHQQTPCRNLIQNTQNQHQHPSPDHMSIQTPVGVPNIEIFPINDEENYQQQVNTNYRNDCSNPISSARSLPDIANLRVSNSCSNMAPSYSDQRIPTNYDYNYDANCNIVTGNNNGTQNYYSQEAGNHPPQLQETNNWQLNDYSTQQQNPEPQTLHQEYYQQQSRNQGSMPLVRANSANTVSNSWHNNNILNASTMIDNNLSKSSQGCYSYLDGQSASNNYCEIAPNNDEQDTIANPIMRSRSCNNIEQVVYQDDNRRNSAQQLFAETQQTCQFYH